jgi:hypothetical protein
VAELATVPNRPLAPARLVRNGSPFARDPASAARETAAIADALSVRGRSSQDVKETEKFSGDQRSSKDGNGRKKNVYHKIDPVKI